MKRVSGLLLIGMLLGVGATCVQAQTPPPAATTAAPASGFRAEFLKDWDDFATKIVRLAEAMPAEKFTWRPGEGVRSVSEIYLHIASGNFGLPRSLGIQPPAGIELRGLERSTTEKAKVVELLKQSFEHVRQAALKTADADLDKPVKIYGQNGTAREVFYVLGTHQHEHFGLCIAYARFNNVVPPWTADRQAQQPAAAPAGFKAEVVPQFEDAAAKAVRLAEAMPAEKFAWRPGEGVRSVAELYTHMAGGNYGFAAALGVPVPEGVNLRAFESITDKAKVVETLKQSFEHMRQAMQKLSEADMEKSVKFRRRDATIREVLLAAVVSHHEHLGTAIAYARFNNVVPPWTAERQAQQPAKAP